MYTRIFDNLFHINLDFRIFFYNKVFSNFLRNLYIFFFDFYIFFKRSIFFQHAILPLMVKYMAFQNNSSVNFLANNDNLVLNMTKFHHNPKVKL